MFYILGVKEIFFQTNNPVQQPLFTFLHLLYQMPDSFIRGIRSQTNAQKDIKKKNYEVFILVSIYQRSIIVFHIYIYTYIFPNKILGHCHIKCQLNEQQTWQPPFPFPATIVAKSRILETHLNVELIPRWCLVCCNANTGHGCYE